MNTANGTTHSPGRLTTPVFLLTIDTEEEWDWSGEFPQKPFSTRNIEQIPDFQKFCKEVGVSPTYFVDHAVCEVSSHVDEMKSYFDADECDIGAHLHPWCTPPIEEKINERNSHAVNLSERLFRRKLRSLTTRLEESFGKHPYSYRAGRWGINGSHLRTLAELGYRVDSSVRPFYFDKDFSYVTAPTSPFWPSFTDAVLIDSAQQEILEVPTTSGYNKSAFEQLEKIHAKLSTPPLNKLRFIGILWRLNLYAKNNGDTRRLMTPMIFVGASTLASPEEI